MSRTRPTEPDPDPRFPFPHTTAPTRCRRDSALFDLGFGDLSGDTKSAAHKRLNRLTRKAQLPTAKTLPKARAASTYIG